MLPGSGPYLRSVVVRDAAVTTWIDDVDAPIRGYVDKNPLHAGDRVGADGRIATIENPIEDGTPVARPSGGREDQATRPRLKQSMADEIAHADISILTTGATAA
jgi:hypothetical protein